MSSVSPIAALLVALGLLSSLLGGCQAACDGDGDGFCNPEDCDDADPLVNPDARERCNGLDDNCNGGLAAMERDDFDGDGTADCFDCDDEDPATFPGATELCDERDNDCDGEVRVDELDNDNDGYRGCDECDDTDPNIFPGAQEVCDGADTDCDEVLPPTETDQDDDGFIECDGDCDPNRGDIYPGAPEVCDGRDNNCDTELLPEEAVDNDGDTHPPCTDCDDNDFNISPDVEELCDGVDNNCDGEPYLDPKTGDPMEKDDDEDGWLDCEGDCDDEDPLLNPGAFELVENGVDEDCDGVDPQPGWTPYADDEATMLDLLDGECTHHWGINGWTADFDQGTGVVSGTVSGVNMTAESGGVPVDVLFESGAAFAGPGSVVTDGGVDSLTIQFDVLQDFVMYAIEVETPGATDDYAIDILQLGTSLIVGPTFGGTAAASGWDLRGAASHWHLGFDEMVFLPATPGEVLRLDELSFCLPES